MQTSLWATVLGTPLMFLAGAPAAITWVTIGGRTFFDGEKGMPNALAVSISDFPWLLPLIPLLGLPFGVIGARLGRRRIPPRGGDQAAPCPG